MGHWNSADSLIRIFRPGLQHQTSRKATLVLSPRCSRGFASQTYLPVTELAREIEQELVTASPETSPTAWSPTSPQILTSLYDWPTLEPTKYAVYNPSLLGLPLRRDILHRAVVYEGDNTRAGTAMARHRTEVHGSGRKLLPQKGTGKARVGDKKSPIRRGGGVAFPPRGAAWLPNRKNYKTDLPRKIYDRAFRTALSYRHQKGELFVIENKIGSPINTSGRYLNNIFEQNLWGRGKGGAMVVTVGRPARFFTQMSSIPEHGVVKDLLDVDVKDLLEKGRVVIEKEALDSLLVAHMWDLGLKVSLQYAHMGLGGQVRDKGHIVHAAGALEFAGKGFYHGYSGPQIVQAGEVDYQEEEELAEEDVETLLETESGEEMQAEEVAVRREP